MGKIKSKDEVKKIFYVYCPECKKEIKGTSPSQVEYNLKLHLETHKKYQKKKSKNQKIKKFVQPVKAKELLKNEQQK